MGLILDSSLLIDAERRGLPIAALLQLILSSQGETESALSAITALELTHGIYRAKSDIEARKRQAFVDEICEAVPVQPVTLEIAQLAGKIEGEQAAKGIIIAVPDLLIGVTALRLGFSVATLNDRHFRMIPGLEVVRP